MSKRSRDTCISGGKSTPIPAFVLLTSRGVVPHLTPDLVAKQVASTCFYFALEDFVGKGVDSAAILSFSDQLDSPLKEYSGIPNDRIAILGPRRVSPATSPVFNTEEAISISTSTGFQPLTCESYYNAITKLRPELSIGLCDVVPTAESSRKRREKMVARTERWVAAAPEGVITGLDASSHNAAPSLFAPVLPIDFEEQRQYLSSLADEQQRPFSGLALYDAHTADVIPAELSHLLKLSLFAMSSPHDVVDAIASGLDLLTASFMDQATDAGICMCFSFDIGLGDEADDRLPLGVDMWATNFATDMRRLVDKCQCYACQKHTRAYIQHLLSAKEMLAWTLIQLHNVKVMEEFFRAMRFSIAEGSFDAKRETFHRKYEPNLPSKTGQGPRVRGYQFKSEGPNERRKNPPTFVERRGAREPSKIDT